MISDRSRRGRRSEPDLSDLEIRFAQIEDKQNNLGSIIQSRRKKIRNHKRKSRSCNHFKIKFNVQKKSYVYDVGNLVKLTIN